jgi:hypothetical protein
VLERLGSVGERTYRTDLDGSVTLRIGADGFSARSYRQQQRAEPYPDLAAKLAACGRAVLSLESD